MLSRTGPTPRDPQKSSSMRKPARAEDLTQRFLPLRFNFQSRHFAGATARASGRPRRGHPDLRAARRIAHECASKRRTLGQSGDPRADKSCVQLVPPSRQSEHGAGAAGISPAKTSGRDAAIPSIGPNTHSVSPESPRQCHVIRTVPGWDKHGRGAGRHTRRRSAARAASPSPPRPLHIHWPRLFLAGYHPGQ